MRAKLLPPRTGRFITLDLPFSVVPCTVFEPWLPACASPN